MSFSSKLVPVTVGVSIALLSNACMADTVAANASVANVQYQLVDFTPDDNYAPEIYFVHNSASSVSTAQNKGVDDSTFHYDGRDDDTFNGVSSAAYTAQSASYSFYHGGVFGYTASKGYQLADGTFDGRQSVSTEFILSPNTGLILTGNLGGNASAGKVQEPLRAAFSSATVSIGASGSPYPAISTFEWSSYYPGRQNSESFQLGFYNVSSDYLGGTYTAVVVARGFAFSASPVPEPETYAMMLAGLGLLGLVAQRKARQKLG